MFEKIISKRAPLLLTTIHVTARNEARLHC